MAKKENKENKENKKSKKLKSYTERITEMLQKDNQFKNTLKLINTFNLAKNNMADKVSDRDQAVTFLKKTLALEQEITMKELKIDNQ